MKIRRKKMDPVEKVNRDGTVLHMEKKLATRDRRMASQHWRMSKYHPSRK